LGVVVQLRRQVTRLQQQSVRQRLRLAAVAGDRAAVVDQQGQLLALADPGDLEQIGGLDVEAATGQPCHRGEHCGRDPHTASTTTAAPPRRGSPPPENRPRESRAAACTPPKNRLSSRKRPIARPARSSGAVSIPGSAYTTPSSKWTRGAWTASPATIPSSTTRMTVCRIAERIRFDPALPRTSSGAPSRSTAVGDIMLGIRRPGGWW